MGAVEDKPGEENNQERMLARLKGVLRRREVRRKEPRRMHVIINPAAGRDQPILKTLNAAFKAAGVDWDVFITKEQGDGRRLAKKAARAGVDAVVINGGDGTVMEVASGLIGSETHMAIIPGGTANVMALELGLGLDLVELCALAVSPDAVIRKVDVGQIGKYWFILRASMGFEAAMVEGADREMKDRYGVLAYTFAALQALTEPQIARYHLTIDGQEIVTEGLSCIIANAGNVGLPGVSLSPAIEVSDGLLDLIVVRSADLPALVSLVSSMVGRAENTIALQHWQGKEITVVSEPVQTLQIDGELLGETPVIAKVIPGAVGVIVPASADQE